MWLVFADNLVMKIARDYSKRIVTRSSKVFGNPLVVPLSPVCVALDC